MSKLLNSLSQSQFRRVPKNPKVSKITNNINNLGVYNGVYLGIRYRASSAKMSGPCTMITSKPPTCPKCHQPMRLKLVKGTRGRKYQCIDCEGEDPLHSRDISKLLEQLRPPE